MLSRENLKYVARLRRSVWWVHAETGFGCAERLQLLWTLTGEACGCMQRERGLRLQKGYCS